MDTAQDKSWLILSKRYGGDIRNPSSDDLAAAMAEMYNENISGMTEADYAEHPSACLRFGFDDGPMYTLDVYRKGRILFGQWADQDYENELAPETAMENVAEERALHSWIWLANGDIDRLKKEIRGAD